MTVLCSEAARTEPVKIVLERRVKVGAEPAFEAWANAVTEAAARHPAHQGSSVLSAAGGEYFILIRFAGQPELDEWWASAEVVELLRRGDPLAVAGNAPIVRTGLETWFTVPGHAAPRAAPPRWKMALVTWLALLPQVLLLGMVVPGSLPVIARVAVSTAIPVAMLTWVIMPRLTRLLNSWL